MQKKGVALRFDNSVNNILVFQLTLARLMRIERVTLALGNIKD